MRILITGSRKWTDETRILQAMLRYGPAIIVNGDCKSGADAISTMHARKLGWEVDIFPVKWVWRDGICVNRHDGPIRNQAMVDSGIDICLAFMLDNSSGTMDCVKRAKRAGIPVIVFREYINDNVRNNMKQLSLIGDNTSTYVASPTVACSLREAKSILVFDMSNIAHRSMCIESFRKLTTKDGRMSGHILGTFRNVMSFVKKAKPPVAMVYALDGFPEHRYDIYPEYKGNRDRSRGDPKPDISRMARILPGHTLYMPHLEADDAIASFIYEYNSRNYSADVYIVSSDGDMMALASHNISIWRKSGDHPIRGMHSNDINKIARETLLRKSLLGDSSDNIKGIPYLNKSHALSIIEACNGDVDILLSPSFIPPDGTQKSMNRIRDNINILRRNISLISLRIESIRKMPKNDTNIESLIGFFVNEFECVTLEPELQALANGMIYKRK